MQPSELLPGDLIQARLQGTTDTGAPEQWLVTVFPVTTVSGTVVNGSVLYPAGLDSAAGWEFDLLNRAVTLPDTLTEIAATLTDGSTATLMGKGTVWSEAATGAPVDAARIAAYTPLT